MGLETQENPPVLPVNDCRANVDTSRPFRSVKEAVAVFDERLLLGQMFSSLLVQTTTPPSPSSWKAMSPRPNYKESEEIITPKYGHDHHEENIINIAGPESRDDDKFVMDTLKKLEAELEETKVELKLLKERESETEVALASLNAELHKNMSKLAQAEAAAAAKASNVLHVATRSSANTNIGNLIVRDEAEKNKREWMIRMEDSTTSLAQILSIGTENYYGGGKRERKKNKMTMMKKKKPIVPLVQDFFFWKKGSSDTLRNDLYSSSPQLYN